MQVPNESVGLIDLLRSDSILELECVDGAADLLIPKPQFISLLYSMAIF